MSTYLFYLFILLPKKDLFQKVTLFVWSCTFQTCVNGILLCCVSLHTCQTEHVGNSVSKSHKCIWQNQWSYDSSLLKDKNVFEAISSFGYKYEKKRKDLILRSWIVSMLEGSPCTVSGLLKMSCCVRLKKTYIEIIYYIIQLERYKIIPNKSWQMMRKSSEKLLTYLQVRMKNWFLTSH